MRLIAPERVMFYFFSDEMASTSRESPPRYLDLQNPDDLATVHELLNDSFSCEENCDGDADDTDTEECLSEREGDSETDQGAESSDEGEEDSQDLYVGKDGITQWSKRKNSSRGRLASHNILLRLPGTLGDAKNAKNPLECWKCFFSNDIMELIVKYTNIYIESIQSQFARERDAKLTDMIEFKSFIGLLYLAGVLKSNRLSLEELWGEDGYGVEMFRLVMNLKRFKFLIRCTRFDNVTTRTARKEFDKLAPVREIFDLFTAKCQESYSVGNNVTVDEKLEGFRGRCSFVQYIPSKPNKYGIKIYASVDSKMFYTNNMEIYAGKQPDGPYEISNKPTDVVMRILRPLYGSGRNVTCDNWFTSIELLKKVKEQKLSLLGTLRKNKRELPPQFVETKSREIKTSIFGFTKETALVSYVPKKGKNVLLISSMHSDDAVDSESGKPQMILDYNATKSGVDVVDKLCATYNVARNVRRWPMVIFFALLNVAGINSEVIHISNNPISKSHASHRREYLKQLCKELCMEQMQRRSTMKRGIPSDLQDRLKKYQAIEDQPQQDIQPQEGNKRKRCAECQLSKKVRYSKYKCLKCNTVFCLEHSKMVCKTCVKKVFEPDNDQSDEDME